MKTLLYVLAVICFASSAGAATVQVGAASATSTAVEDAIVGAARTLHNADRAAETPPKAALNAAEVLIYLATAPSAVRDELLRRARLKAKHARCLSNFASLNASNQNAWCAESGEPNGCLAASVCD